MTFGVRAYSNLSNIERPTLKFNKSTKNHIPTHLIDGINKIFMQSSEFLRI